jgi:hypothetical protein
MIERKLTREEIDAHNNELLRLYRETVKHNSMFPDDPVVEYDYIHDWLPYESEKMERLPIVEESRTHANEKGEAVASEDIGFYRRGDEVIFRHCIVGCDGVDDWTAEETFPIEDYRNGIQELMKKGSCSIKGADLSEIGGVGRETMRVRKMSESLMEVYYSGFQRSGTIYLNCNVNKLVVNG